MKRQRSDNERTAMPKPESISPRQKAGAGRTPTSLTPVVVQGRQVSIDGHHREYVREKLGLKLGKFAHDIERIHVRFGDINGPKGGLDHSCRIQVMLPGMGVVIVEEIDVDPITAFDRAEQRLMNAVEHRIGRVRASRVPAARKTEQQRRAALATLPGERRSRPKPDRTERAARKSTRSRAGAR